MLGRSRSLRALCQPHGRGSCRKAEERIAQTGVAALVGLATILRKSSGRLSQIDQLWLRSALGINAMDTNEVDEDQLRNDLMQLIASKLNSSILDISRPEEPPLLGEDYELRFDRLFNQLDRAKTEIAQFLSTNTHKGLSNAFDDFGQRTDARSRQWFTHWTKELSQIEFCLHEWLWGPFRPDQHLADFKFWAQAADYTLDEAVWLSVGLQPLAEWIDKLAQVSFLSPTSSTVLDHLARRRELFRRGLDPRNEGLRLTGARLQEWVTSREFTVHAGFRRMLEEHARLHSPRSASQSKARNHHERSDSREKRSLAILITAMAIEKFGYDPEAKQSTVPQKIKDVVERQGLDVSLPTIRKYLTLGREGMAKTTKEP